MAYHEIGADFWYLRLLQAPSNKQFAVRLVINNDESGVAATLFILPCIPSFKDPTFLIRSVVQDYKVRVLLVLITMMKSRDEFFKSFTPASDAYRLLVCLSCRPVPHGEYTVGFRPGAELSSTCPVDEQEEWSSMRQLDPSRYPKSTTIARACAALLQLQSFLSVLRCVTSLIAML